MKDKRVILLEFNEINTGLIKKFIGLGYLPNFKALYEQSHVYKTHAETDKIDELEPWVQWVTVHSGLKLEDHGVRKLGEGNKLKSKLVAEVLSDAGIPVGIFSSMNTNYTKVKGFFIPDPWDRSGTANPIELQDFYSFVRQMVQEHSQNKVGGISRIFRFGLFMLTHGLSFYTIKMAIAHLFSEVFGNMSWRRASVLDHIQYDVFRFLLKKHDVKFATFFSNSVAHYQHYFWRNMDPASFTSPPDENDPETLKNAILCGYQSMDKIIGRVRKDFPQHKIIMCSALTQEPWKDTEKVTYRPRDFKTFLNFANIANNAVEVKPVMAEQFYLDCSSKGSADAVEAALQNLEINGKPAMLIRREGDSIFTGCLFNTGQTSGVSFTNTATNTSVEFDKLFNLVSSKRSGKHNPEGLLWVQGDGHGEHEEFVQLTDIAPTLLDIFDIPIPEHMKGKPLSC